MNTHRAIALCSSFISFFLLSGLTVARADVSIVKMPASASRPQVRVDTQGNIHIVYADRKNRGDLLYIKQKAGTKGFTKPIKVNSTPRCAAGFNMAVGKNGRVHVLIRPNAKYSRDVLKRQPRIVDLKFMLYCRLNDEGTQFEPQRDLSGTTYAFEGVGAVIADGNGTVYVYWHGQTQPGRENTRQIYLAKSQDEGVKFTKPQVVHKNVVGACTCCSMQGTMDAAGKIYLGFRNSIDGGNKDSYLLVSSDRGKSFTGTMLDPWPEAGCPGSTYSLSSGPSGVFIAWNTLKHVYFAKAGEESHKIVAPTTSKISRSPVVATNAKGEMLFAWVEGNNPRQFRRAGNLAWQLYDKNGNSVSTKKVILEGITKWSFPAVYAKPNGDFVIFYDGPGKTHAQN